MTKKKPQVFTGHLIGIGHSTHEVAVKTGTAYLPALMLKVVDQRDGEHKVLRVLFNHDDTQRVAELLHEQSLAAADKARVHFEAAIEVAHLIAVHEHGEHIEIVRDPEDIDHEKEN